MKPKTLIAIVLALNTMALLLAGCITSTDPATGVTSTKVDLSQAPQNVDLAVDLVEAYAAVFAAPKDYQNIVDYAERLRKAADLPALKLLLAQIKGGGAAVIPATQPTK